MHTNLDKYREDLDSLIKHGESLHMVIQYECYPEQFLKAANDEERKKIEKFVKDLPRFSDDYQNWYSEAKVIVRQLLPDRLSDFIRHYEKPKPRKTIDFESYRIEDYLQGLVVSRGSGLHKEVVADGDAALPHFRQQLAILKSVSKRFESSLFNIQNLVQADLFDSELDAAKELLKNKFTRASGVICGVILEKHLKLVCDSHEVTIGRKKATIGNFNDALKDSQIIEVSQWRFIQHLADIRNICGHDDEVEPTKDQVSDLIQGVSKITKTLY